MSLYLFVRVGESTTNIISVSFFLPIPVTSVADPDPVGSGLFGSPRSGSGSEKIPDPDPEKYRPDPQHCSCNYPKDGLVRINVSNCSHCVDQVYLGEIIFLKMSTELTGI